MVAGFLGQVVIFWGRRLCGVVEVSCKKWVVWERCEKGIE